MRADLTGCEYASARGLPNWLGTTCLAGLFVIPQAGMDAGATALTVLPEPPCFPSDLLLTV